MVAHKKHEEKKKAPTVHMATHETRKEHPSSKMHMKHAKKHKKAK